MELRLSKDTTYSEYRIDGQHYFHALPVLAKLDVRTIRYQLHGETDPMDVPNHTLELFTMDLDPTSPEFGIPGLVARTGVLIFHYDDNNCFFSDIIVTGAIESFIETRLAAVKAALPDAEAAKLEYEKFNGKVFKKFFKEFREQQALHFGNYVRHSSLCPVKLTTVSCEGCGVDETVGGSASNLRKCGKCKGVLYCSRDCQVSDRKAHKPFCKVPKE